MDHLTYTKQYSGDFDLLKNILESFAKLYTTPNVLTEVSNLGKNIGVDFFDKLNSIVQILDEKYCLSKDATLNRQFRKVGLTDSGLLELGGTFLIVTVDFALYQLLYSKGADVVNFNHLRPFNWTPAV